MGYIDLLLGFKPKLNLKMTDMNVVGSEGTMYSCMYYTNQEINFNMELDFMRKIMTIL